MSDKKEGGERRNTRRRGFEDSSDGKGSNAWSDSNSRGLENIEEGNTAVKTNQDKHFEDNGDEIVLIPDLDEEGGVEADQRVVHAPRNINRKVPTSLELETEFRQAFPVAENGIDLSVLTRNLVPLSLLQEDDTTWSFEGLMRDVYSELGQGSETADAVFTIQQQ